MEVDTSSAGGFAPLPAGFDARAPFAAPPPLYLSALQGRGAAHLAALGAHVVHAPSARGFTVYV